MRIVCVEIEKTMLVAFMGFDDSTALVMHITSSCNLENFVCKYLISSQVERSKVFYSLLLT